GLLVQPCAPAGGCEPFLERSGELGQVTHVVRSVGKLLGRQRTARPVGARMSLRELDAEDLPDELRVADLRREAEEGGSLLRVECRRERRAGQRQQRLDVLARRVQQLRATVVRQLPRERAAVRDRKRVDEDNLAADRGLDQAELREVGALANELG